jgi:hypothetical protein
MPERESKVPSKVSVEDLLRLKRSERPAPEFWTDFERTLRQKQLAALVEKRSWWHNLAADHIRVGRLGLPVGAAAILALTLVSVRDHFWMQTTVSPSASEGSAPQEARLMRSAVAGAYPREVHTVAMAVPRPQTAEEPASTTVEKGPAMVAAVAAAAVGASRPAVTPVAWLEDALDDHAKRADIVPAARAIAVNLAALTRIEPDLIDSAARPLGFEERAMPVTRLQHSADMLPTAAAVTEPRRTRLLASLGSADVYAPEPSAPEHARRNVLRYLAQDGWDRSMSRLEAEGDKLSIKF